MKPARSRFFLRRALLGLALILLPPAACSASLAPGPPDAPLRATQAIYDAGELDSLSTQTITHTFTVQNRGKAPVEIENLDSSCGCTTALVMADGRSESLPVRLMPGRSLAIRVQVDVSGEMVGRLEKSVWVSVAGHAEPVLTLTVSATFPPLAQISPFTLDFGQVHEGVGEEKKVDLDLSPRLTLAGTVVTLTCSLDKLSFGPPKLVGPVKAPDGRGPSWERLEYTTTLAKDAPLGSFATDIDAEITRMGALGRVDQQLLPDTYAVARGEVVGDISTAPKSVVFGVVEVGQGATRTVTVKAASPEILAGVSAASGSPWVTVSPGKAGDYDISIVPNAPPGVLQATATFTTRSGEKLAVPVLAYVGNGLPE